MSVLYCTHSLVSSLSWKCTHSNSFSLYLSSSFKTDSRDQRRCHDYVITRTGSYYNVICSKSIFKGQDEVLVNPSSTVHPLSSSLECLCIGSRFRWCRWFCWLPQRTYILVAETNVKKNLVIGNIFIYIRIISKRLLYLTNSICFNLHFFVV